MVKLNKATETISASILLLILEKTNSMYYNIILSGIDNQRAQDYVKSISHVILSTIKPTTKSENGIKYA